MITVSDAMNAFIKSRAMFQETIAQLEAAWIAPADRATARMMVGQMKEIPELNTPELSQIESELGGNNAEATVQRETNGGYGIEEIQRPASPTA
mgnify:CR=1 FL=1